VIGRNRIDEIRRPGQVLLVGLLLTVAVLALALFPKVAGAQIDEARCPSDETCEKSWQSGSDIMVAQADRHVIPDGETVDRDLYLFAQSLQVDGTLDGDVIGWVQEATVLGTITEDMLLGAQRIRIEGQVTDDVRVFCQDLYISGTIDGHLLGAAGTITLTEESVVKGDVLMAGGTVTLDGDIEGAARVASGALRVNGTFAKNAEFFADGGITIGDDAQFGADVYYEAPSEVDFRPGAVAGQVQFSRMVEDVKESIDFPSQFGWIFRILSFIAAIVAGVIIVALTRNHAVRTAETIRTKPLKSLGIGFIAFICIPIVLILTLVLVVTIPLMFVLLMAYLIAIYIAKFYVAIWLGNLMLGRSGRTDVSPIPGLLLGLIPMYLLTAIPYVGTLIGIIVIFFGLGALLQRKETGLDRAFEPAPPPPNGLPTFPGSSPAPPAAPAPPTPPATPAPPTG